MSTEKAAQVRAVIADVVGFEPDEVQNADRFTVDYNIGYGERKILLERLNATFGRELDFNAFCALDDVGSVVAHYAG
mgnify:CR=1 FL=1